MTSRKPPSQRDSAYVVQRMSRAIQSMAPGTMGGRVANAAPVSIPPSDTTPNAPGGGAAAEAVFSFFGILTESVSGPYTVASDGIASVASVAATLNAPGSAAATIDVLRNGTTVASIVLDVGISYATSTSGAPLAKGDILNARITRPGNGGTDLTVQVVFG